MKNNGRDEVKNNENYESSVWAWERPSSNVSLTRFVVVRYVVLAVAIGAGIVALDRYYEQRVRDVPEQPAVPSSLEKRCFEEIGG